MVIKILGINTLHRRGRERLSRPDDFVTVTIGDREYSIVGIATVATHANIDDSTVHKTLMCEEINGCVLR